MNIVLFGFMGTGKTAVAQALARRLGLSWTDMDRAIEERAGMSITRIFEKHGESHFRSLERSLVEDLVKEKDKVISTGGGVVTQSDNVKDLMSWGLCICLNSTLQAIYDRTKHRHDRPLLKGDDPMKKIRDLLREREGVYRQIPIQIDTTDKSVYDVVEKILEILNRSPAE